MGVMGSWMKSFILSGRKQMLLDSLLTLQFCPILVPIKLNIIGLEHYLGKQGVCVALSVGKACQLWRDLVSTLQIHGRIFTGDDY